MPGVAAPSPASHRHCEPKALKQPAALLLVALLLTASLAACGKKGDPAPPDPGQNTYPRTYPKTW